MNKLFAPYDISEASIRHQLVSFGKEPLYSDRIQDVTSIPNSWDSNYHTMAETELEFFDFNKDKTGLLVYECF